MPTRRIDVYDKSVPGPCMHPEHVPPMHIAFAPGVYEHECPACRHVTYFRVEKPNLFGNDVGTRVNTDRFQSWPADVPAQFNGSSDPCDMFNGPCSCGAWHTDGK